MDTQAFELDTSENLLENDTKYKVIKASVDVTGEGDFLCCLEKNYFKGGSRALNSFVASFSKTAFITSSNGNFLEPRFFSINDPCSRSICETRAG